MNIRILLLMLIATLTVMDVICMERRKSDKDELDTSGKVEKLAATPLKIVLLKPASDFAKVLRAEDRGKVKTSLQEYANEYPKANGNVKKLQSDIQGGLFQHSIGIPNHKVRSVFLVDDEQKKMVVVYSFFKTQDIQLNDINYAEGQAKEYRQQNNYGEAKTETGSTQQGAKNKRQTNGNGQQNQQSKKKKKYDQNGKEVKKV